MAQYLSPGVYVEEVPPLSRPIAGVGTSTPGFIGVVPDSIFLPARPAAADTQTIKNQGYKYVSQILRAPAKKAYQIGSWNQYVKLFGDFIGDPATPAATPETETTLAVSAGQRRLAHAVFGFFNNGGSSCYVLRITAEADLESALSVLAAIGDITMVAAPGLSSTTAYVSLIKHCELLQDRVAILDSVESDVDGDFDDGDFSKLQTVATSTTVGRPPNSTAAAFYFPWVQAFDPATSLLQTADTTKGDGLIFVPPSGHIAGVYARSDSTRGVFKAPANEALLGVTGLKYSLSKPNQDSLNDDGVNLIRPLIGAIRVWGARTVGGDANGEYRYISTRRYFNYLRESIDQGTQFVVFEPNTPALWERIKRTVGGFLLKEWRNGALFGTTPDKAFYVKCDADTNPAEVREAGQVVTEIGVAIVKPAEFVIFRIQQMAGA
jgi:Bacteriophage tail sheath protein